MALTIKARAARLALAAAGVALARTTGGAPAHAALRVTWMPGSPSPGTPARLDRVGVIKIGRSRARNVLVLEPGTSAGSAYFVPLAKWIVSKAPAWQVWSVERRENLLEDQSMLTLAKTGRATAQQAFDYYLDYLVNPAITHHFHPIPDASVVYARQWGMRVAVEDLHRVIAAARRLGGRVVLGGHSLGGSVVTAYATWNFHGRPGADDLAGLVYDDGGSISAPVTANAARAQLRALAASSPWLAFSGVPAPYLGLFSALGSTAAIMQPNAPSLALGFPLLPAALRTPVPATNLAVFGYDTDTKTSRLSFAVQAHLGSLDTSVTPAGWSGAGAITPIERYASMLSGTGVDGADGTEWYFPMRLTIDSGAVGEGTANPAQRVLGLQATDGRNLPRRLRIYAFGAAGGSLVTAAAATLARQSHIPASHLVLVDRQGTYAHNDPAAAYPNNAFFAHLVPFLRRLGA